MKYGEYPKLPNNLLFIRVSSVAPLRLEFASLRVICGSMILSSLPSPRSGRRVHGVLVGGPHVPGRRPRPAGRGVADRAARHAAGPVPGPRLHGAGAGGGGARDRAF